MTQTDRLDHLSTAELEAAHEAALEELAVLEFLPRDDPEFPQCNQLRAELQDHLFMLSMELAQRERHKIKPLAEV